MKLYAISDLHTDHKINHDALENLPEYPEDWLILAGDTCVTAEELRFVFEILTKRFARLLWVPGNHDLWTDIAGIRKPGIRKRGEEKYRQMIEVCHDFNVITPEDPYPLWQGEGGKHYIVPLFLLYDYSFRPDSVSQENAVAWAMESGIVCTDEYRLDPEPYPGRAEWCHARCRYSEQRMLAIPKDIPLVMINHFPLRKDLAKLFTIPRFSIWCGTKKTENWHIRFKTSVVVSGHLHIRRTCYRDGVRFEEVSLGYPKHWNQSNGIEKYLRQILPPPPGLNKIF